PATPFEAFATGNIIQVLFISLLVGVALSLTTTKESVIAKAVGELEKILFKILAFIMFLAPLGAFGALAAAIGAAGGTTLVSLLRLILLYYPFFFFFFFVVFELIARLAGLSILKILTLIKEEVLLVQSPGGGDVAFPRLIEKLGA